MLRLLDRVAQRGATAGAIVGAVALASLSVLTFADVSLRWIVGKPIRGAYEIVVYFMLAVSFGFLAYTESKNGHVGIEFVLERLGTRTRALLNALYTLIAVAVMGAIAWQGVVEAMKVRGMGLTSEDFGFDVWPFRPLVTVGVGLLALQLVLTLRSHILTALGREVKK